MRSPDSTLVQWKSSEDDLRKVLTIQQTLLDTTGAMVIATDNRGIIMLFNREAVDKLGYKTEDVIGKKTPVLFHNNKDIQRKRNELLSLFGIRIKKGFDVLVEKSKRNIREEEQYLFVKKNGDQFPVSLTITALYNTENEITGFVGVAIDITERIKAEKELLKTRQLFLHLLHNYPDGCISIIDKNFRFVFTGGELHRILQSKIPALIGDSIFPKFPDALRKFIFMKVEEVFRKRNHITGLELPYPIKNHTYMFDAFPLIDEGESIQYVGVIIKNISKLKEAEESLREALKKEKSLGELKSRFVSMASHEFRTPLSTILSSAYLIEKYKNTEDQPKREIHLQRITSSVEMLTDILNEFLNIGKIEEGRILPRLAEFNIRELMQGTLEEIKINLKKEQQIFYKHLGKDFAVLDKSLFKQIVLNLISNASKFSSEKAVIKLKTSVSEGETRLSINDDGIGIPKEEQIHLTERFFRASNAINIQGTGLGLHIVSRYAEMMNGAMNCQSQPGRGTTIVIKFKTQRDP